MAKSRLSKPLPCYFWDPLRWQASRRVQRMDWAARGLYRELMDECYLKGCIPASLEGIADLLDCDVEEIANLWSQVARCFDPHPLDETKVISPFIETIRAEQLEARIRQSNNRKGGEGESSDVPSEKSSEAPPTTTDHQSAPEHTTVHHGSPQSTTDHHNAPASRRRGEESTGEESTYLPPPAEEEGGGAKPPRRAAAAFAPGWLLEELKALGIVGSQAKSMVGKLGVVGVHAALVKLRTKKAEKNAVGLLVRKGAELAEEGGAILQTRLDRALALAPKALQDPKWATLPEQLQQDPEVRSAWCVWKAAEGVMQMAGEHMRLETGGNERQAMVQLLELLEARHPDPSELSRRMKEAIKTTPIGLSKDLSRRVAFWKSVAPEMAGTGSAYG